MFCDTSPRGVVTKGGRGKRRKDNVPLTYSHTTGVGGGLGPPVLHYDRWTDYLLSVSLYYIYSYSQFNYYLIKRLFI